RGRRAARRTPADGRGPRRALPGERRRLQSPPRVPLHHRQPPPAQREARLPPSQRGGDKEPLDHTLAVVRGTCTHYDRQSALSGGRTAVNRLGDRPGRLEEAVAVLF